MLQRTLRELEDELGAHAVERLVVGVGRGVNEVREHIDIDWTSRHRAIDTMLSLLGMYPSRNASGNAGPGETHIHLHLRSMDEPVMAKVIEVTPNPAS